MLERLGDLYFELSNEDRLNILTIIEETPMKLTGLSKELGITNQECSRHLTRLLEAELTRKGSDGLYHLTPFGELSLRMRVGQLFTVKHREYFNTHTLKRLPQEFVVRIGELGDCIRTTNITLAFFYVEKVIREANEYLWDMTDQYLVNTFSLRNEAFRREVKLKSINSRALVFPKQVREWYRAQPELVEVGDKARSAGIIEERLLDGTDVFLCMSEKEGIVAFPLPDGGFDYLGFTSTEGKFHKWCGDLFDFYWRKARSRASIVEELYDWVKGRPKAVDFLKYIATEKDVMTGDEIIPELESKGLVERGVLTLVGEIVYSWVAKKSSDRPIDFSRYWTIVYKEKKG